MYWNFEQPMLKFNLIASSRDAKRPAEHQGRLSFFAGGNKATMHIWIKPQVCINSSKWLRAQGKNRPNILGEYLGLNKSLFSCSDSKHKLHLNLCFPCLERDNDQMVSQWGTRLTVLPLILGRIKTMKFCKHTIWKLGIIDFSLVFTVSKSNFHDVGPPQLI